MNPLSNYYGSQYSSVDAQQAMDGYGQDANTNSIDAGAIDATMLDQPQTLDQIINQNNQELMRRRRTYQANIRQNGQPDHGRRASMLEFGSANEGDLADFQFDPNPASTAASTQAAVMMPPHKSLDPRRVRSREDLSLDTRFSQLNPKFDQMPNVTTYSPAMLTAVTSGVEPSPAFMSLPMDMAVDFDQTMAGNSTMDIQSSAMQPPMFTTSPISQTFSMPYSTANHDPGGGSGSSSQGTPISRMTPQSVNMSQKLPIKSQQLRRGPAAPSPLGVSTSDLASPQHIQQTSSRRQSLDAQSPFLNNGEMTMDQIQAMNQIGGQPRPTFSKYHNAYSTSGFDMLGVLMRVATRRNPDISIGPVDLSCAFVVCDIDQHDLPIVYCSDMFERLTGYTRYEILGRNCRFLQAPDGKVQSGIKRKYVDDKSVLYLKNQIIRRQEAQLSLINYRKGGQPFMNLLTMIPIPWDTEEFRYFVGFQVDLVEQPGSVSGRNPDGTYAINYNRSALPAYALPPPPDPSSGLQGDFGQTVPRDEVSQVLSTIGTGETELSKRIWDKVLLENTDDVVHVLSLKGLFLYLSPSSRKVLEYDTGELVGTALSAVCHPSDIVPVTRELKDSSNGAPVNVVYRIRRKHSGYTWFEAHGCLHTEQGKGRKCIILVGRERPVYALEKDDVVSEGGVGDSELWSKISTSGMFLYVSSNSRAMLDRLPEDLVGTSMQNLMRPDSKKEFMRLLEAARCGEKVGFKHDLQNRRGQVLQAQTTLYPGDARKGFKPTFLLAQTRLLKLTRATLLTQKSNTPGSTKAEQSPTGTSTPNTLMSNEQGSRTGSLTPAIISLGEGVMTQSGGHGLPLGNQDEALASEDNVFDELKTTRSTSWQFELRQMERQNRLLAEELQGLISRKKKRKRRKGMGQMEKDCANCHTRVTPEWRRGPSGNRDLCNSCGLRWAKQNGRVSPRKHSGQSDKSGTSPAHATSGQSSANKDEPANDVGAASGARNIPSITMTTSGRGDQESAIGNHPPKIDEGDEPPHPNVLPA